mmetsp:Transcript_124453/g.265243  ORF Transcript_124453/g.265243 Transcript_124453/m.265243 type:complete len:308 (+) Transcript_124453:545-1468(+)
MPLAGLVPDVSNIMAEFSGTVYVLVHDDRRQGVLENIAGVVTSAIRQSLAAYKGRQVQSLTKPHAPVDLAEEAGALSPVDIDDQHVRPSGKVGCARAARPGALLATVTINVFDLCVLSEELLEHGVWCAGVFGGPKADLPIGTAAPQRMEALPLLGLPLQRLELMLAHAQRAVETEAVLHTGAPRAVAAIIALHRLAQVHTKHVADETTALQVLLRSIFILGEVPPCAVAYCDATLQKSGDYQHECLMGVRLLALCELLVRCDQPRNAGSRNRGPGATGLVNLPEEIDELYKPLIFWPRLRIGLLEP